MGRERKRGMERAGRPRRGQSKEGQNVNKGVDKVVKGSAVKSKGRRTRPLMSSST
jgi:hypothetical protein